jgi:hypothetical protein
LGQYIFEGVDTIWADNFIRIGLYGGEFRESVREGARAIGVISVNGAAVTAILCTAADVFSVQ